jgi:hypothetical protein
MTVITHKADLYCGSKQRLHDKPGFGVPIRILCQSEGKPRNKVPLFAGGVWGLGL